MEQDKTQKAIKELQDKIDRLTIGNILRIGELDLQSNNCTMNELRNIAKELLQDENVKGYLGNMKLNKMQKNFAGYFG